MKNIIKIFTLLVALLTVTNTADARLRGDAATRVTSGSIIGGRLDYYSDAKCETKLGTDVAAGSTVYIKAAPDAAKCLGAADANGKVSFIKAEQTISSNAAQSRTRADIGIGDYVDVYATETQGVYYFQMPADQNINVKVSVEFPNTQVSIKGWTYGDAANAPTLSAGTNTGSGVVYAYKQMYTVDNTYTTTVPTQAGYYIVRATINGDHTTTADFIIAQKALTIIAEAKTKVYGEKDPELTYTSEGLVGSDAFTGALTRDEGNHIGTYAIRQGTLTAGNSYRISYTGADFTITKADGTITDPNQFMQITSIAGKYSIDENSAVGTLLAQLTVVDKTKADGAYESLNYTLISEYGNDVLNEVFQVDEVNNFAGVRTVEIRVKNQEKLDYENLKFGAVNLYAENKSGDYATAQFDIIINDLHEDFTLSNQTFTLPEKYIIAGVCYMPDGFIIDPGVKIIDPNNRNYKDFTWKVETTGVPFDFYRDTNKLMVTDGSQLDYKTKPSWTFKISVSDGEYTHSATITVNLTDVNERPQISDCMKEYTIKENTTEKSAKGKVLGTLYVEDYDKVDGKYNELTYSLEGKIADIFEIKETANNGGKRTVSIAVKDESKLDYEKLYNNKEENAIYPITIAADDNQYTAFVKTKIVIEDVNEDLTATGGTFYLNEHSPIGSKVGKVVGTDYDTYNADFSKLSYKMSTNNTGNRADVAKKFNVDPRSGLITSNAEFDYETESKHQYTFMVTVSDGEFSKDVEVNVNIQDIEEITSEDAAAYKNQAPEITNSAPIEVAETKTSANGVIGNITATDPDTNHDPAPNAEWGYTNLRYMLNKVIEVNGSTDFPFEIDENTGAITIREGETLNFAKQNKYQFEAKVTDCPVVNGVSPLSTTAKITIIVTDDNTAPKFVTLNDVYEVEENVATNTEVDDGNIVVYDEDDADIDNLVITINSDLFEVVQEGKTNRNTHKSTFAIKTRASLDYETILSSKGNAIFDVKLTIKDAAGNTSTQDCQIRVIDVNEEPAFDKDSYTFMPYENTPAYDIIGEVITTDPDNNTLYYSLEGDDAAQFTIDANGIISTVKGTELDYETKDTYKFYAVATDKEHTVKVPVTVTIINEQEAPRFAEKSIVLLVDESAEKGTVVGTVTATDDDMKNGKAGKAPTYSLNCGRGFQDGYIFDINESTGEITVKEERLADFNTKHEYRICVSATDGDDPSLTNYVDVVIKTRLKMENLFSAGSAFTSYVAPENMAVPEGLSAYAVTDIDGTSATIQQIDYLPQSVPVLIKRADKTENLYKATTGNGTAFYVNKLQINETDREVSAGELYLLYRDEFVLTSSGTLPAGSVYLPITDLAVKTRSLTIGNGEGTTSIENLTPALSESEGEWYDLQGRRLGSKPTKKGIYISNGRKVVIK